MASQFQYIAPGDVVIEGVPATEMTICAATGRAVGRLRGFIIDATERHIRYVVVRGSGLFAKTTLLPFSMPRVDFDRRTIRVDVSDQQVWQLRDFTPDAILA
ncbi:MAG: PRC-barrel domain-containing protein [Vicinamibacterales bacterium]